VPICVFHDKDTPVNLETALGMYRPQLLELAQSKWQGKAIRIFLFGDYEFQTTNYGLSGSSGARPCLHCLSTKKSMALSYDERPMAERAVRTLESLSADLQRFTSAGSNLGQAKLFNNVIRPVILPIPICNVIIPVLHLDLGIFPWILDAMVKELRTLDKRIAVGSASSNTDSTSFQQLDTAFRRLHEKEDDVAALEQQFQQIQQQLQFVVLHCQQHGDDAEVMALAQNLHGQYTVVAAALEKAQHDLTSIRTEADSAAKSKDLRGPCENSLEPVLQAHKIQRQVYHGGAFIGNHINLALEPTVVTALTAAPVAVVAERLPALKANAEEIAQRYHQLFTMYAKCRSLISHCNPMSNEEIDTLDVAIKAFMAACRADVVERSLGHITPKLHLLEDHTVPLIKEVHVGLGLLAEQGAESIHAQFNTLERSFVSIPAT